MGVTSVVIPVSGTTGVGFGEGANSTLGPIDLVTAVLPGYSTRGATLAIAVSGGAFTGMNVKGSVDGSTFFDVVEIVSGTKASISTGSQLIVLGANYPWLKVEAHGGATTSYLAATIVI